MESNSEKLHSISVRVSKELNEKLKVQAHEEWLKVSTLVRKAITIYLEKHGKK